MSYLTAVRIVKQWEDTRFLQNTGEAKKLIRVRFMVGDDGPFTEEFDADTFSDVTRDQRLQERARHIWVDADKRVKS